MTTTLSGLDSGDAVAARRPWIILASCCLALFLVTMAVTIMNVALPDIRRDLHASIAGLQWSIDGYVIVYGSFLMLAGSAADRLGGRRAFELGIGLFSLGSLACAAAPNVAVLIACRMLQGLGGAILNPATMTIIVRAFPEPKTRARAIGIWGTMTGASMLVGPILGGYLTTEFGWRAIFAINVPFGLAGMLLTALFVPALPGQVGRRFDPVGQSLVMIALAALVGGLIEGPRHGWMAPASAATLVTAVAAVIALVAYESRRQEPLIELHFFRSAPFSAAIAVAVLGFAAFNGFLFFSSFYLQGQLGLSPAQAGLRMVPAALAIMICAPLAGQLVSAGRDGLALLLSGVATALGAVATMALLGDNDIAVLFSAFALFGIGLGLANTPVTHAAISGMPHAQAGLAAGLASTSRSVGAAIGIALAGSVVAHGAGTTVALTPSVTQPFWWLVIGCGLVIVVLALPAAAKKSGT